MIRHKQHILAAALVVLLLSATTLACTLDFGLEEDSPTGSVSNPGASGGDSGVAPQVTILEPASGAVVPANQPLELRVQTNSTTTSFILMENNRVASSKALPDDQNGPVTALLTWTPNREGSYTLEVIAFNGANDSLPASVTITVSGTAQAPSQPGQTAGCTGRVLVSSLNYRSGPGTEYGRLGQFSVGETVTVVGRNNGTTWYKVQRLNAEQVWVFNNPQWLQTDGQCGALPVTN